jgi:enoyl-CoA hydratase/carnithine racemase
MSAGSCPSLQVSNDQAVLWLNRSEQANRLDNDDLQVFGDLLTAVAADPRIRVLTLRAKGGTFCSGYDIKSLAAGTKSPGFDRLVDWLEGLRIPTIAALTGSVYGGGTDLVLACDFRIGVPGLVFSMPAARLGIHYYYGGMRRYVTRLGLGAAKRLFLCADRIDSGEMLRIGFLDEVIGLSEIDARVDAMAKVLAENAPTAVQKMKMSLNHIAEGTADPEAVEELWRQSLRSADLREGLAALAEKRRPSFQSPLIIPATKDDGARD